MVSTKKVQNWSWPFFNFKTWIWSMVHLIIVLITTKIFRIISFTPWTNKSLFERGGGQFFGYAGNTICFGKFWKYFIFQISLKYYFFFPKMFFSVELGHFLGQKIPKQFFLKKIYFPKLFAAKFFFEFHVSQSF